MAKNKFNDLINNGKELIKFYRSNPCIAAYDLLGVDLAPIQRLVFRDMWFKNYVIAVCGRGIGKTVTIDSLCNFKGKGLVYLYEQLPKVPEYLKDGEDEIMGWSDEVYTSDGFRNIKKLCLEKGVIGKKIVTHNRFEIKGSTHHPLLTLNKNYGLVYKCMDEFEVGDRICIQRNQQSFGNTDISLDDAYIIGLLIGDGCISNKSMTLTSEDESTISFCVKYCIKNNIGWGVSYSSGNCTCDFRFHKDFKVLEKYKVARVTSYTKSVPYSIRTATKEAQVAFLQGYFDTDGTASNITGNIS